MKNPFQTEQSILDNQFILITEENEFRMSHWVKGFGIIDNRNGETILELNTSFHLERFEEKDNVLLLVFMVYPIGSKVYHVEINLFDKTFLYQNQIYKLENLFATFKEYNTNT